jgi:hypothetical protein
MRGSVIITKSRVARIWYATLGHQFYPTMPNNPAVLWTRWHPDYRAIVARQVRENRHKQDW